ncbi:MAG: hypothetical protein H6732_02070 [Alphaproteobacteria bacterium]|nr:hypothetical protein [Alphaproteobacteria bacterium]
MSRVIRRRDLEGLDFLRDHLLPGLPVVLEGAADGWPALAWTAAGLGATDGFRPLTEVAAGRAGDVATPAAVPWTLMHERARPALVHAGPGRGALPPAGHDVLVCLAGGVEVEAGGLARLAPGDALYLPPGLGGAWVADAEAVVVRLVSDARVAG